MVGEIINGILKLLNDLVGWVKKTTYEKQQKREEKAKEAEEKKKKTGRPTNG